MKKEGWSDDTVTLVTSTMPAKSRKERKKKSGKRTCFSWPRGPLRRDWRTWDSQEAHWLELECRGVGSKKQALSSGKLGDHSRSSASSLRGWIVAFLFSVAAAIDCPGSSILTL